MPFTWHWSHCIIYGHVSSSFIEPLSVHITPYPNSSRPIQTHQNSSELIRTHQNSSKLIRTHQNSSFTRGPPNFDWPGQRPTVTQTNQQNIHTQASRGLSLVQPQLIYFNTIHFLLTIGNTVVLFTLILMFWSFLCVCLFRLSWTTDPTLNVNTTGGCSI